MQKQSFVLLNEEIEKAIRTALYAQAVDIHSEHGKEILKENICRSVIKYIKNLNENSLPW